MPLVIQCPSCSKRYQVADAMAGKQVRCQQCQTAFTVTGSAAAPTANKPPPSDPYAAGDPFPGVDLGSLPSVVPPPGHSSPLGAPVSTSSKSFPGAFGGSAGVSNPSGGPTDKVMRLVSGGMLAAGILMVVATLVMNAKTGTVYLAIIALAPLALILGTAGLISPNVVRAVGKYGGHLSWHYKAIGYGLLGLYFVILILLMIGLFLAGFQPDRPGLR